MRRVFIIFALAVVGALGVTVALPPAAASATIIPPYPVPPPLNVLPSVVTAGSGYIPPIGMRSAGAMARIAVMLRSFAAEPAVQAAIKAKGGGVLTPAQTQVLAKLDKSFKVPAVKMAGLVKGVGTAAVLMYAQDLVIGASHWGLELIGFDPEGSACATGNDVVRWFAHVDCGQFDMTAEAAAAANNDIQGGFTTDWACLQASPGVCYRLVATAISSTNYLWVSVEGTGVTANGSMVNGPNLETQINKAGTVTTQNRVLYIGDTSQTSGSPKTGGQLFGDGSYSTNTLVLNPATLVGLRPYDSTPGPKPDFQPVVSVPSDPERFIRCQITLSDSSILTRDTVGFKESEGYAPPPDCPNEFPAELSVSNITIWEMGGGQTHELYNESVTPEYDAMRTTYPECMGGACLLDLRNVDTESCFVNPGSCADWFKDPDKESTYSCHYGSHAVALSECNVYAPTFKPDTHLGQAPYGDPFTGEPLVGSGPGPFPLGVQDPELGRQCLPEGWGVFNPLEWILRPVVCALEWAFVPRPTKVADAGLRLNAAWATTPIAVIGDFVDRLSNELPELDGCEGPPVAFTLDMRAWQSDFLLVYDGRPLSACAPPMDWVAGLARTFAAIVMVWAATRAITKYLGSSVNMVGYGGSA